MGKHINFLPGKPKQTKDANVINNFGNNCLFYKGLLNGIVVDICSHYIHEIIGNLNFLGYYRKDLDKGFNIKDILEIEKYRPLYSNKIGNLNRDIASLILKNISNDLHKYILGQTIPFTTKIILETGNLFDYIKKDILKEMDFVYKVITQLDKIIEDSEKKHILLFDIDETICLRVINENRDHEDYVRPSFFLLINFLKQKYSESIDFGVLSSRYNLFEDFKDINLLGKILGVVNSKYIFSSFGYPTYIDEQEKYYSQDTWFPERYGEKVNALSDIKLKYSKGKKFILIDDIIKGGKLDDFGEGICIKDSAFNSCLIGL